MESIFRSSVIWLHRRLMCMWTLLVTITWSLRQSELKVGSTSRMLRSKTSGYGFREVSIVGCEMTDEVFIRCWENYRCSAPDVVSDDKRASAELIWKRRDWRWDWQCVMTMSDWRSIHIQNFGAFKLTDYTNPFVYKRTIELNIICVNIYFLNIYFLLWTNCVPFVQHIWTTHRGSPASSISL